MDQAELPAASHWRPSTHEGWTAAACGVLPSDPRTPSPGCWPDSDDQALLCFTGTLLICVLSLCCTALCHFPDPGPHVLGSCCQHLRSSLASGVGQCSHPAFPHQLMFIFALHLPLRALPVFIADIHVPSSNLRKEGRADTRGRSPCVPRSVSRMFS